MALFGIVVMTLIGGAWIKILSGPARQKDVMNTIAPTRDNIIKAMKWELKYDKALAKEDDMSAMAPTPDGRMAVGYYRGDIDIFSSKGKVQRTELNDVRIRGLGFLSDGRCVIIDISNIITLFTREWEKLEVSFGTLSDDKSWTSNLAVDRNDLIYVSYWNAKKIQVFSPAGGKAIREIPFNEYEPAQITSYNDMLIVTGMGTVATIDKDGNVKYREDMGKKSGVYAFAGVTRANSILIAWVNHDDWLVSIDEYTNTLKHIKTLISDQEIEKHEKRWWYYLREFRSGEIAFCTRYRLYIFKLLITNRREGL